MALATPAVTHDSRDVVNRADIDDAIASLARELQGVIEVARMGGLDFLPRPSFLSRPASAPDVSTATQTRSNSLASPSAIEPAQPSARPSVVPSVVPPAELPQAQAAAGSLRVVECDGADALIATLVTGSAPPAERLERLCHEALGDCRRCKLHRGRHRIVFGAGNPKAELVFVGGTPGADEDRQGQPFVGEAGQLLTRMIAAMGRSRDDVYVCNVLKCRPPNNRDPAPDEVEMCERFLKAQLAIVKPRVIVALGPHAAQTLLRTRAPISQIRGVWHHYDVMGTAVPLMATYHPAFLLQQTHDPQQLHKREAWSDLQKVMAVFPAPRG